MVSDDVLTCCDLILSFSDITSSKKASKTHGNEFLKNHAEGALSRDKLYANLSDKEVSSDNLIVEAGHESDSREGSGKAPGCLRRPGSLLLECIEGRQVESSGDRAVHAKEVLGHVIQTRHRD